MTVKEKFIETFGIAEDKYDYMHNMWLRDLAYFNHNPAEAGYEANISAYIGNKAQLFNELKEKINPDFYNGNLQWVIPFDMVRDEAPSEVCDFVINFPTKVGAKNLILSKKNEDGKTMSQVFAEAVQDEPLFYSPLNITELKENKIAELQKFTKDGISVDSEIRYGNFLTVNNAMRNEYKKNVANDLTIDTVNQYWPMKPEPTKGMKTAKLFNRLYRSIGFTDSDRIFMQNYAAYSDLVSCNTRHMYMVFSLNPNDYLRMSFGPNWSSCQTIDSNNKRRIKITSGSSTYSGMCRCGTLSYMNDGVTIIMYVIPANRDHFEHPELEDKDYRNNLHYQDHWLVQGRIYPQGNDGATDLYKEFRYKAHEVLNRSTNNWVKKSNYDMRDYVESGENRLNYEDYFCFNQCNITYEKGHEHHPQKMAIGSAAYCVHCGRMLTNQGSLLCRHCAY